MYNNFIKYCNGRGLCTFLNLCLILLTYLSIKYVQFKSKMSGNKFPEVCVFKIRRHFTNLKSHIYRNIPHKSTTIWVKKKQQKNMGLFNLIKIRSLIRPGSNIILTGRIRNLILIRLKSPMDILISKCCDIINHPNVWTYTFQGPYHIYRGYIEATCI